MKQRILCIMFILVFLFTTLLFALPVQAGPPEDVPRGKSEQLPPGWQRLNPHTKTHKIKTEIKQGKKYDIYEAEIESLPTTLDDNKTLIDTQWYLQSDISGQRWFQSGVNTFSARVLEGRVSVKDENGRLSVWDSSIIIGNEKFSGGIAEIVNDPLNENYEGNCLLWEYEDYSNGWWVFGESAPVKRYLRVLEGYIAELWILPIDPRADVIIDLNESAESAFGARIIWLNAYDTDCVPLKVAKDSSGNYIINATEFNGKKFPVTIDPTEYFDSSYYDGHLQNYDYTYSTCRSAANASSYSDSTPAINVGQGVLVEQYFITRGTVSFYTANLPNDTSITSATLYLSGAIDSSDTDFYVTIQSGMPTYPHLALEAGDYNYNHYSGNGGQLYTSGWNVGSYNFLNLNSTGRSWINLTGWTKFLLRSNRDIAGNVPTGYEYVGFRSRDYGLGSAPRLYVTYVIPVSLPTVTTLEASLVSSTQATLEGYLADDGSEACSVRFQYGTSTSYGSTTAWDSGYETGDYFDKVVYGLSPGTAYHFRAQAINSAGTSSGSDKTFVTPPYAPYNFTATAGDGTVALTWNKGTGADKTMIRRNTTAYPTSPTDGTQVYFDTGTGHDDNAVVNGTTYYYSAWSEKSGVYSITKVSASAKPSAPTIPTVTTNAATSVAQTTAKLNLYLDDLGGYESADVWFQYYTGEGAWTDNETTPAAKSAPCSHSANIASLTPDTLYHMRAAAQNTHGTAYGADVPFTTGAIYAPTMTTQAATGVQMDSATLNGVVTDDGGATCTVWFEWGLTTDYGNSTPTISGLSTSDIFYYGLTNLEPGTTYHYRAIGQNSAGIGFGGDQSFLTTAPTTPTVRTDAASSVGAHQATLNATVLTDGGVECEVRFQYGLTDAYGTDTEWVAGYTKNQAFNKLLSTLTIDETYHFRAQVKNAGGTGSGDDATFTTIFTAPTNFRAKAISSTTVNLEWAKSGDGTYIKYKQNGFPIDRADGDPVYFGSEAFSSISGLMAGTTYYFRAWAWAEGDVWAEGYADDVGTTQAIVPAGEEESPEMVKTPEEPQTWFQPPSGAAIEKMPFYESFVDLAEHYEMPEGTMWLTIALSATILVPVIAFAVVRKAFVAVVVGGLTIAGCSILGMAPLWFIAVYAALGGGLIFVTSRM